MFSLFAITSCGALNNAINNEVAANKKTLVDFPVKLYHPDTNYAKSLDNPSFKLFHADLAEVLPDFKENICVNSPNAPLTDEIISKCAGNEDFSIGDMIEDATSIGFYDLNKDGKQDLIIALGGNTGLSGLGVCGTSQYRFYENVGNDYRPIGKVNVLNAQNALYL